MQVWRVVNILYILLIYTTYIRRNKSLIYKMSKTWIIVFISLLVSALTNAKFIDHAADQAGIVIPTPWLCGEGKNLIPL